MSLEAQSSTAPRLLVGSARLVAAIGAIALVSTGEMETPLVVVFLAFFFIGLRVAGMRRLARALTVLQPFLAAALLILALGDFFRISQSFLLAVAHFLIGIQAIRLLALNTPRENLGSVLVSSLMILSAATLAVDWTFFLMLIVFLPAVVWTLMLHTIVLESQDARDRALGQPALGEGSPAWRQLAAALRRSAAAAFGVTAVCCAVVFTAFPRFNLQGFRGQFLQPVRTTGFTNQVDLQKSGKIFTDDSVVMRIEISPEDRPLWSGYVRGGALESFDGRTWRRSERPVERVFPTGWQEFQLYRSADGRRLRQSIYLESMDTSTLFGAPHVTNVKIDRPFLELSAEGAVQRPNGDAWRIHYDVISAVGAVAPSRQNGVTISDTEREACTEIAGDIETAKRLAVDEGGRGTPPEIAERLSRFLTSHYQYSLTLPSSKGVNPIEYFLGTSRVGHCEYFASAMCVMLRYRDIPARMVTGFYSQEWNSKGHYYVVRMRDAHAWVEYFDPARGWIEIDPSPRDAFTLSMLASAFRQQVRENWDFLNLRWNRYILSYDIERQIAFLRTVSSHSGRLSLRLERSVIDLRGWMRMGNWRLKMGAADGAPALRFNIRPFLLPLAAAAVIAAVLYFWKSRSSERVWFYPRLVKFLVSVGARAGATRTLRELVREAEPNLNQRREGVAFLENEYYRLRFDPSYRPDRQESRRVRETLKSLKV